MECNIFFVEVTYYVSRYTTLKLFLVYKNIVSFQNVLALVNSHFSAHPPNFFLSFYKYFPAEEISGRLLKERAVTSNKAATGNGRAIGGRRVRG